MGPSTIDMTERVCDHIRLAAHADAAAYRAVHGGMDLIQADTWAAKAAAEGREPSARSRPLP
jgi:hypothetical protein